MDKIQKAADSDSNGLDVCIIERCPIPSRPVTGSNINVVPDQPQSVVLNHAATRSLSKIEVDYYELQRNMLGHPGDDRYYKP